MHLTAGSDVYGRVKTVGKTPVVTRFAMLNAFPLVPLESYYFAGTVVGESVKVPLIYHYETKQVLGFPLARVDKVSVAMTYLRGVCGALMVVGVIALIPGYMVLLGERLDGLALRIAVAQGAGFVVGAVVGLLSYLVPFQTTRRERDVRRACGEVLGICADPAKVRADIARSLGDLIRQPTTPEAGDQDVRRRLVRARLEIALGGPREVLEAHTDDLLEQIRIGDLAGTD